MDVVEGRVGDGIGASVNVDVEVRDAVTDELVRPIERVHNLFVTKGLQVLADALAGSGTYSANPNATHIGVGTSATAAAAADVALGGQVFRGAITKVTRSAQSAVFELYLTSTQGNGSTLREAGLFNGDTGAASPRDAMLARVVHAAVAKTSSITITYRWTVALTAVA